MDRDCKFCAEDRHMDHRYCDECKGAYHVDIELEKYIDSCVIGSCGCGKYREELYCGVCLDHDHIQHCVCNACRGVYHINKLIEQEDYNVIGECNCGMFAERTANYSSSKSDLDSDIESDIEDDVNSDIEDDQSVYPCQCGPDCQCDNQKFKFIYRKYGIYKHSKPF